MCKDTESKLLNKIEDLKKEIESLKGKDQETIPSYQYSKITFNDLEELVEINQKIAHNSFDNWFNSNIDLDSACVDFLSKLIEKEKDYIKIYNEEDLKVNFIIPVLNKIDFKISSNLRGFYEEQITYKTDRFIFNGTTDFLVSEGFRKPKKPYFFIQEFKKGQTNAFPEPQLLAELIAAIELNNWFTIKGAYIVGAIWNFVILEKLETDKYQYFVSPNFDCTKIEDLQLIYKNLLFVKAEIIKMTVGDD
jgi:hypothetical protein